MQEDVADRVKAVVKEHLGVDEAPEAAHLFDDLGADSLDAVELTMALEEEFEIEIPNDDMEAIRTVGDAVALVQRLTAPEAA